MRASMLLVCHRSASRFGDRSTTRNGTSRLHKKKNQKKKLNYVAQIACRKPQAIRNAEGDGNERPARRDHDLDSGARRGVYRVWPGDRARDGLWHRRSTGIAAAGVLPALASCRRQWRRRLGNRTGQQSFERPPRVGPRTGGGFPGVGMNNRCHQNARRDV